MQTQGAFVEPWGVGQPDFGQHGWLAAPVGVAPAQRTAGMKKRIATMSRADRILFLVVGLIGFAFSVARGGPEGWAA
jgi:hypothetical protein